MRWPSSPNPEAPQEPPALLRKTLSLYGVKSDAEVREIFRVGQTVIAQLQAQQAMAALTGGKPGGMGLMPSGPTTPAAVPGHPGGTPAHGPTGMMQ